MEPTAERALPPPLTRAGRRTRGALLRSARGIFEARGYHQTRIGDITAAAGTSVGTFYTYFDSKEDLFRHLLIDVENEVYGELRTGAGTAGPAARIRETNRLYLESFRRNARFWAVVEEASLVNEEARRVLTERRAYYHGRAGRAFARWQDQGLLDATIDIDFAATALGLMTERCAYLWFVLEPRDVDLDAATEDLTGLWLAALRLPA